MHLHVLRHLSKTLKNVELKTFCMPGSSAQFCLNVITMCITMTNIWSLKISTLELILEFYWTMRGNR